MDVAQQPTRSLLDLALIVIEEVIATLLYGTTGGLIDLSAWLPEIEENTRRQIALTKDPIMLEPKRFEAYTDCPKCGSMDFHRLRAPMPPLADTYMRAQLAKLVPVGASSPAPVDESQFEVIRICQCGFEWGQL